MTKIEAARKLRLETWLAAQARKKARAAQAVTSIATEDQAEAAAMAAAAANPRRGHRTRFTREQRDAIRAAYATGIRMKQLALDYGVTSPTIAKVLREREPEPQAAGVRVVDVRMVVYLPPPGMIARSLVGRVVEPRWGSGR